MRHEPSLALGGGGFRYEVALNASRSWRPAEVLPPWMYSSADSTARVIRLVRLSAEFGLLLFAVEPGSCTRPCAASTGSSWTGSDGKVGAATRRRHGNQPAPALAASAFTSRTVSRHLPCIRATEQALSSRVAITAASEILVPMAARRMRLEGCSSSRTVAAGSASSSRPPGRRSVVRPRATSDLARLRRLNDLTIDRGSTSIFEALLDSTVERVRRGVRRAVRLRRVDASRSRRAVPCRQLIAEWCAWTARSASCGVLPA